MQTALLCSNLHQHPMAWKDLHYLLQPSSWAPSSGLYLQQAMMPCALIMAFSWIKMTRKDPDSLMDRACRWSEEIFTANHPNHHKNILHPGLLSLYPNIHPPVSQLFTSSTSQGPRRSSLPSTSLFFSSFKSATHLNRPFSKQQKLIKVDL